MFDDNSLTRDGMENSLECRRATVKSRTGERAGVRVDRARVAGQAPRIDVDDQRQRKSDVTSPCPIPARMAARPLAE